MTDLTSTLLSGHYHYEVEEWSKQGGAIVFDSGKEQRLTTTAIPAITMTISYRALSESQFLTLRAAYEANHSNTIICDLSSFIDKRPTFMTTNAAVWKIDDFVFQIDAREQVYRGKIMLTTSVMFNFAAYQDLFAESSTYTRNVSTDTSLSDLLEDISFGMVELSYVNNSISSSIGVSVRHTRDKGGLRRKWVLNWYLNESDFTKLITFYRKKAGIMGVFGLPEIWTVANEKTNARFEQDSLQYSKDVNGFYTCRVAVQEVIV